MVSRQGELGVNTLGNLDLLFNAFDGIIEKTWGEEDDLNTVAAGTMTGMSYRHTGGLQAVACSGLPELTLISLYAVL